jgi:alpha-L-arabinofuranosidase
MMLPRLLLLVTASLTFLAAEYRLIAASSLTVEVDKPGHRISPLLYGIFFEDINCSADGGLYAELVRNRNFEDSEKPDHWSVVASAGGRVEMNVDGSKPVSAKNHRALKVTLSGGEGGRNGVANDGFWGISIENGAVYKLSLHVRSEGRFAGPLTVSLEGGNGTVYARKTINNLSPEWKEHRLTLKAGGTDPKGRLVLSAEKPGVFWVDMVSLFPAKTWKNRPNGLRPDLAQMLAGLRPAFVRFPGGCWVEGETMSLAYRWKQTIGNPAERRTQHNIWQYKATHGIGYHEYLQLCEDLQAEPLFVINCGMSHREVVPMDQMGEFVQDALDAIEYANGPVTSTWGAARARNGHPAPFHLKYLEIGNENGGPAYHERYALFHDAIKAKYPGIQLIANEWGGSPKNRPVEIIDEHYYSNPEFFINQAGRYDTYDRNGLKVYVGEYAVTQGCGQGNLRAAVGEAAFMTGMERNSDVVVMASYAPLFANVHYKKWNPDLINFDSSRVYGLPGYYVQKMFSENRGDVVLPVTLRTPEVKPPVRSGAVGVGTWLTRAEFKDLKVTRDGQVLFAPDFSAGTAGWRFRRGDWSAKGGGLRQESLQDNVRAFAGDKSWNQYTYSLKARKLSGAEGFLIPFLVQDEEAKCWWNIGGWGNTRHALEMEGVMGDGVPGRIETDRWYDIRIEVRDASIKCYLDGKLIHDATYPRAKALYATASLDQRSREVILKIVNASREPQESRIMLSGARVGGPAKVWVLASERPEDENSLEQPMKVAPVASTLRDCGADFARVFPVNSVTVMRMRVR